MNEYLHPESSPLFTPWTDPVSGVVSHVLTTRAARWQQGFYFTNSNVTDDGRWIWVYASEPPSGHVLGLVDNREQTVEVYPDTGFEAESPFVDTASGEVFFTNPTGVYRRAAGPSAAVHEVGVIGDEVTGGRDLRRLSTHLTRSADGRLLNLDVWAGNRWQVGTIDIDDGSFEPWLTSDRRYQHSQFHPSEPGLLLAAQDYWHDPDSGERRHWDNRIWLIDGPGGARPLFPDADERVQVQFHEWWAADGSSVYYVDVGWGTRLADPDGHRNHTIWPSGTCHSHASADGRLLVGDINTYFWEPEPCRVAFFDTTTGAETDIVSNWPRPHELAYRGYHPDPHPRFVLDDEFIAYTTSVLGGLDLALVRVAELRR